MVQLALAGEFVPFAVNVSAAEASETVRPFLPLAEKLGRLYVALNEGTPETLEVSVEGQIADYDTRILTLSVLKGVFGGVSEEPVSYVNAPQIAAERGVDVQTTASSTASDYVNLVTVRGGDHAIAGTLVGLQGDPRIVMLDGNAVDLPPARYMLVARNEDVPGMIATVTRAVADAGIKRRRHAPRPLTRGQGRDGRSSPPRRPSPTRCSTPLRQIDGIVSVTSIVTD